jgi:hypothetical protein
MFNDYKSSPKIRNSIIWGNSQENVSGERGFPPITPPLYAHSLVEGHNPSGPQDGGGNLDGTNPANNPLFGNPVSHTAAPAASGDYYLKTGSPAIDTGSRHYYSAGLTPDLSAISADTNGNPRFKGAEVDMGAYERQY